MGKGGDDAGGRHVVTAEERIGLGLGRETATAFKLIAHDHERRSHPFYRPRSYSCAFRLASDTTDCVSFSVVAEIKKAKCKNSGGLISEPHRYGGRREPVAQEHLLGRTCGPTTTRLQFMATSIKQKYQHVSYARNMHMNKPSSAFHSLQCSSALKQEPL